MSLLKWLVTTLCVVSAYASQDDTGPQRFASTPALPVSTQSPRYVMKDAILYLTPTQIKALEATQGLNKVVPVGNMNDNEQLQKAQYTDEELRDLEEVIKNQLQQLNMYQNDKKVESSSVTPIVVLEKQPNLQQTYGQVPNPQIPITLEHNNYFLPPEQQNLNVPESYSFIRLYSNKDIHETPKLHFFHPIPHERSPPANAAQNLEVQEDPLHHKRYKLVPYQFLDQKSETKPDSIQSWVHIGGKPEAARPTPAENHQLNKLDVNNLPKYLSALKYAPQFAVHKNAAEYQKLLSKIKNDNAIAKAEAIKSSIPTLVQKEETLSKKEPLQSLSHVNVPIPMRVYVPVTPLEIKQPYPLPLEIIDPLAIAPIPYINVERPYFIENILPVEIKKEVPIPIQKPEKLTIIRHVWKH